MVAMRNKERTIKHEIGDLILVRWLDAHNFPTSWETLGTADYYTCTIQSVGWFVHSDEQQLILSADVSTDDDGMTMINTYFAIPIGCIIDKTVLRSANG